ncbi:MAG: SDR family oxidoreductase [Actinobacteria bacterium]|nr:SDR family oxidoreductase [Actinomycetota bacterium]
MTELAVVGGATGALGSAIVGRLRVAGLGVVAVARTESALRELAAGDSGIIPVVADLEDDQSADTIASAIDAPVRMVVQAAGLPASGDIDSLTGAEVAAGMNGKIGGFLRLIDGCRDRLHPGSRLVVLGGHYGEEPSYRVPLAGMANAALANLVRSLADRWGPDGVTVHLVAPGPVESPRMEAIAQRTADRRGDGSTAEDVLDEYRAGSPLGRLTTIDEVAWAVSTLLASEAAALHGSSLKLDGGRRRGNA